MKKSNYILKYEKNVVDFWEYDVSLNTWTQKAASANARAGAVSFNIGSKGYIGTGEAFGRARKDFWEYDPAKNFWTQKADFGGRALRDAVGFSIGSKGYIGSGGWGEFFHSYYRLFYGEFWEYNPAKNVWTQKNSGPTYRSHAIGFSINNKGYFGTGYLSWYDENEDKQWEYYKDFYEYDPATDNWTRKADFGGMERRNAVGFSISGKGYIGTGTNDDGMMKDFFEYDPSTDTWTQKADFAGGATDGATGFSIGSKGYISTGSYGKNFWEYDPVTNTWSSKVDFAGTARTEATSFTIGSKGYIGTGSDNNGYTKDFWEYTPGNLQNTSYGTNALSSNSSGLYNSAFGYYSLYKNTIGNNNSAFGYSALYGNKGGNSNTAFGSQALHSNTNGNENTTIGTFALLKNVSGSQNTANGTNALYANTTGNYNTASGVAALTSNTTGNNNTASGFSALSSNTAGSSNTATGYFALIANTTGTGNTGIGWSALSKNTTGTYNTAIGNNANTSVENLTNSTALGRVSLITASNQVQIGNIDATSIGGYTEWSNISDGRYKKNLKEDVPGLQFIKALRPVSYNLKVTELDGWLRRGMRKTGKNDEFLSQQAEMDKKATADKERIIYTGFVAQEVEKVVTEIGYDFSGVDAPKNDHDVYALRYAEFVVPLIKAVQELSLQNDRLKNEITEIKELLMQQTKNDAVMSYLSSTNGYEKLSVTISPNPVRSVLNVSIKDNCTRPVITVLDMYGKVLLSVPVTQNQTELDVSQLTAGIYIIKIKDVDSRQLYSGKFIKQN